MPTNNWCKGEQQYDSQPCILLLGRCQRALAAFGSAWAPVLIYKYGCSLWIQNLGLNPASVCTSVRTFPYLEPHHEEARGPLASVEKARPLQSQVNVI